jgi:ABC-type polysaccharide/polyol phosphate transport system ATPase subunit
VDLTAAGRIGLQGAPILAEIAFSMSDTVIKVENISKLYRLGEVGTGTLSHDLNRWWHKVRGKEDPYLKIGQVNDRAVKGDSDYAWALQNVSFEVKRGETFGIIGSNGAGKSTLLKILSRVTMPTSGQVKIKGRIASLLEVGTGFHPELTGRDNIYLNGAILGMRKREIDQKFDEIVAFCEVERYIDTPVKRYSSGMYVRLAFAVAAHLEPEILIVDEVLAVGDLQFQSKCIGKMQDVSRGGRTVLFVSHNMSAVNRLCSKGLLMDCGKIAFEGEASKAIALYSIRQSTTTIPIEKRTGSGELRYASVKTSQEYYAVAETKVILFRIVRQVSTNAPFYISGTLRQAKQDGVNIDIFQYDGRMVNLWINPKDEISGSLSFEHPWLKPGRYALDLYICSATRIIDEVLSAVVINVVDNLPYPGVYDSGAYRFGVVLPKFSIDV